MVMKADKSFQEYYPDHLSHCYGCGRLNEYGLHIKSYWHGEESVCSFLPKEYQIAVKGYVYGGLIASIIDCHATGTAAAAVYRKEGRPMGSKPYIRFLTGSLSVDYLQPTPSGVALDLRARVKEIKGRKVVVDVELTAGHKLCVRGKVVAIRVPENILG